MKLHIGCGTKYLEGYKHVDVIQYEHIDYVTNADNLPMIADETVDEIYACHILEHFTRHEISHVIKEWNRVLVKGGLLRIAVPDFDAIVQEYEHTHNLDLLMGLLYGGQNYDYNFHYQAFSFERLKSLLEGIGFKNIERYDWKEFLPYDYDDFSKAYLPHMDFKSGRLMSLNVISQK